MRPKGVIDGRQVNIPAPRLKVEGVRTPREKRAPCQKWASRKGEGIYDPEVFGSTAKKSRRRTRRVPVLKLTQVGAKKILRRSRERS